MYFFMVLEARSLKSRCQQVHLFWELLPLACEDHHPVLSQVFPFVCLCVLFSSSYKDTCHIGLGPTHMTLFYLIYLFKDSIYTTESHSKVPGDKISMYEWRGCNSARSTVRQHYYSSLTTLSLFSLLWDPTFDDRDILLRKLVASQCLSLFLAYGRCLIHKYLNNHFDNPVFKCV